MNVTAEIFQKAIDFAVKAHEGVYRKGNKAPYIIHPMAVMGRVMTIKKSSNMFLLATVALLHDTVEDVEFVTIKLITEEFGLYVAALVDELTTDKEKCNLVGKKEYLSAKMVSMSSYALVIKLCDRLENVIDMKGMNENFQMRYCDETNHILNHIENHRTKISLTHLKLIEMIKTELNTYQYEKA